MKANIRDAILETAQRMIRRYGIQKTNLDDVARAAKVAKATIYNYFGSKEQVYAEALDREIGLLTARITAAMDAAPSPLEKLKVFLRESLAMVREETLLFTGEHDPSYRFLSRIATARERLFSVQVRILRSILEQDAESQEAMIGLAKVLLAQDKPSEAMAMLENVVSARLVNTVDLLRPFAQALIDLHRETLPGENDLDAIFYNSMRLASQAKYPMALDGLLDILRQDKRYRGKTAQNVILGILEVMGEEDPDTRAYRAELASVLF
jgi:AcrR family transcriptional regulator